MICWPWVAARRSREREERLRSLMLENGRLNEECEQLWARCEREADELTEAASRVGAAEAKAATASRERSRLEQEAVNQKQERLAIYAQRDEARFVAKMLWSFAKLKPEERASSGFEAGNYPWLADGDERHGSR